MRTVHAIVPTGIDDPTRPSGGNTYDLRVLSGLRERGWSLRCTPVSGSWPQPDPAAKARLAGALSAVADGSTVLLDGLVACPAPEAIVPERDRLRLVVLVHLPLGHPWGAGPPDRFTGERRTREEAVLGAAAAVVVTSRWSREWLLHAYRLKPERVHVARPGAEPTPLAPASESGSRLLCVGAVTSTKGQDVLVAALEEVQDLPWACVCVGALDVDPAFADDLVGRIGQAGLSERVRLTGPLVRPELQTRYAGADLVLVPSRIETYGMVVTEALARGLPVICSDVGGLSEAVDGPTPVARPGILVPPDDAPSLAQALRVWLTDPALRQRLRSAARERRAGLGDWSQTTDRVSKVLMAVAA